ncbi:MAG: hypothetical protein BWZ01_03021 [Deltaproteobacteria bacterium ADurb.BinA179]|nr:MAG: hypothetical protein BWZ01_03021 [Deltaproteobacteria bacterium ADurb.BinA179]
MRCASCLRSQAPNAWNVPAHGSMSPLPRIVFSRSFISPAALLVKVRHKISRGDIPWEMRYATR